MKSYFENVQAKQKLLGQIPQSVKKLSNKYIEHVSHISVLYGNIKHCYYHRVSFTYMWI